ncbi:MAG: hypothetical protein HJJLKODD_02869 [Phycisphaerae bacterium]|nr:hypothetical protein [Phycisphaerae bacterium]
MYILGSVLAVLAGCQFSSNQANDNNSGGSTPTLQVERVADGLTAPMVLEQPNDNSGRLFIADQIGKIFVIDKNGKKLNTPLLDLSGRMQTIFPGYDERGLLGFALHPDFAGNGRIFVCYNAPLSSSDDQQYDSRLRLAEWKISSSDSNRADAESEQVLLEILKPQGNHNGGQIFFGPDGMLYMTVGDGGNADDRGFGHTEVTGNGQDRSNLLGKILRLNVSKSGQYTIPVDNPWVNQINVRGEIFAYGLRNAWRCSFDRAGNRALYCGDVGQNEFEEVDIITAGGNYGWRIFEGTHCFDAAAGGGSGDNCPDKGSDGQPLIAPILEYPHNPNNGPISGISVIGGYVYRGSNRPDLAGKYIFGDWSTSFGAPDGQVFVAEKSAAGVWSMQTFKLANTQGQTLKRFILSFGQDAAGELYILTSQSAGPALTTGELWKISSR